MECNRIQDHIKILPRCLRQSASNKPSSEALVCTPPDKRDPTNGRALAEPLRPDVLFPLLSIHQTVNQRQHPTRWPVRFYHDPMTFAPLQAGESLKKRRWRWHDFPPQSPRTRPSTTTARRLTVTGTSTLEHPRTPYYYTCPTILNRSNAYGGRNASVRMVLSGMINLRSRLEYSLGQFLRTTAFNHHSSHDLNQNRIADISPWIVSRSPRPTVTPPSRALTPSSAATTVTLSTAPWRPLYVDHNSNPTSPMTRNTDPLNRRSARRASVRSHRLWTQF